MALTQEQQVIFDAVIASLRTNSKTIEQLTPQTSLSSNDWFELNGGRKVSYTVLRELISALTNNEIDLLRIDINKNILESVSLEVSENTATLKIMSVGTTIKCNVPVATSSKAGIITALDKLKIQAAYDTGNTALSNAVSAKSTADTARTEAATAQSTADTARTEAAAAQSTADAAKEVTDTKDMPGGLASLDDDGFVPQYQLPVAVRNAVEFSGILQLFTIPEIETASASSGDILFIPRTGTFLCRATTPAGMKYYSNWAGADAFGTLTERGRMPAMGKFYIDKSQGRQYFYDGSELVAVSADIAKKLVLTQPVRCADEAELAAKAASAEVGQQFYIPEED